MEYRKRIDWVDTAKAIAVILVGIGHYACPDNLRTCIYVFHMPLFFILSGYTLSVQKYGIKEFVKRKVKSLLIPWAIGVVAQVLFRDALILLKGSSGGYSFYTIPQRLAVCWRIDFGGIFDPFYWFLPCLFITEIVLYFVLQYTKTKKGIFMVLFVCVVAMYAYEFVDKLLPWCIDLLPSTCLFVTFGYMLKNEYSSVINSMSKIKSLIIGLFIFICGFIVGLFNRKISGVSVDISGGQYGNIALCIIGALACSVGMILLCKCISNKFLRYIGKNSLYFYLVQPFAYRFAEAILIVCIPFYASYLENMSDLILLHILSNLLILIYVYCFKKAKEKVMLTLKK